MNVASDRQEVFPAWYDDSARVDFLVERNGPDAIFIRFAKKALAAAGCTEEKLVPCLTKRSLRRIASILRDGKNPFVAFGVNARTLDDFLIDDFPRDVTRAMEAQMAQADGYQEQKSLSAEVSNLRTGIARVFNGDESKQSLELRRPRSPLRSRESSWDIGA